METETISAPPEQAVNESAGSTVPTTVYVSFSAEINDTTAEQLINVMANCANQGVSVVHLLLSTPGGSVMHGINIYNVLRGMPFRLITHNVGNVDSIGAAIFLAGEERRACQHSTFMFHGVAFDGTGVSFNARSTKERLESLLADEARTGSIVTERSGLTLDQIHKFYEEARTMTASDAKDAGIVHSVCDVAIPPGTPIVPLVFNR